MGEGGRWMGRSEAGRAGARRGVGEGQAEGVGEGRAGQVREGQAMSVRDEAGLDGVRRSSGSWCGAGQSKMGPISAWIRIANRQPILAGQRRVPQLVML